MKNKKKAIIILVAVILLLLIPVPNGTVKDGGTKQFTSLTYKVVKWNRLVDVDNIYQATEFYLFPYNFLSLDRLWNSKTDRYMPKNTGDDICSADHSFAKEEQTIPDAYEGGWCGNTMATIILENKEYTFMSSDSITLNALALNHSFKNNKCECDDGIQIRTETGDFTVNLEKHFVRNEKGQGQLTEEQENSIKAIIERQTA